MAKQKVSCLEIGYLGYRCSPYNVPREFLGALDIKNIIWVPEHGLRNTIENIGRVYRNMQKSVSTASLGHVIEQYVTHDMTIKAAKSLPGIVLDSTSMESLKEMIRDLDLPIVYSIVR